MKDNKFIMVLDVLNEGIYGELSLEAVHAYSILRNLRTCAEYKGQRDKNGNIYVTRSQEQLCIFLRCKRKKVSSALCELEDCGLISRVKQGQGHPDRIYVYDPQKFSSDTSCCDNEEHPAVPDNTTYIDIYNIDNTIYNHHIDDVYCALIPQWDYRSICSLGDDYELIADAIIDVAANILCTTSPSIRIAGEDIDTCIVQSTIMRLTSLHIVAIVERLIVIYPTLRNPHQYIATTLYHSGLDVPVRK